MKVIKQIDGLFTLEAEEGKVLISYVGIKCHRAVDQMESEISNWSEE